MATSVTEKTVIPAIKGLSGVQKGTSFQVTNLFVTWPRCDVDKEECGFLLKELLDPLFLVVAEELHADKTPHLHAFVKLKARTRVYHIDLDLIVGKHGNYQRAKSVINCVRYCAKDDDYYADGINIFYLGGICFYTITEKTMKYYTDMLFGCNTLHC